MRQSWLDLLMILLIPVYLLALFVIHELGHTILARLLGDPNAVFYLFKIEEHSSCWGCTFYDIAKLTWGSNVIVGLGGLLASQTAALATLFLLRLRHVGSGLLQRILSIIAFTFALFDVPWQVAQSLTYNVERSSWPTGKDLVDLMFLLQMKFNVSPLLLKGVFLLVGVLYLFAFVWLYQRNRRVSKFLMPSMPAA